MKIEFIRSKVKSLYHVGLFSVDQAISSLSNLVASIIAAHALPPDDFGVFGIVFATYLLVVSAIRAMTGEVLLLVGIDRARMDGAVNLAIAGMAGFLAGAAILCGGLAIGGLVGAGLVPLAIGMAGLTVQDAIRYVGFATKRVRISLAVDILWLVFMLAAYIPLISGGTSLVGLTAVWVASGVIAAACMLPFLAMEKPSRTQFGAWLRDEKSTMLSLLADRGIVSASGQGTIYIIAAFIGLEGNAAYRGAQIVMGPINVFATGLLTAMVPYFVGVWQRRPTTFARDAIRVAALGSFCLIVLTQLAASIPDALGLALVGHSWLLSEPVLRIMALIIPLQTVSNAAANGLRAMRRVDVALRARTVIAPLTLLAITIAAYFGDVAAVIWAQVGCTALFSLIWWGMFLRTYRHRLAPIEGDV